MGHAFYRHNHITIELTTADCLYADTTEPIFIQFFVLNDREIVEKSEKFALTKRGDVMKRGETSLFHIHKGSGYCKEKQLCTNLSFVGLFAGEKGNEHVGFDTWNANNITITFHFDNQIHNYNFDFSPEGGDCIRPLHFWSPEFWHRYGPGAEFEERAEEYSIGETVMNPTYLFF
ncbi:unnamed protein product, partial [Mesorhabditis belari]|uniref:Uncharacterized protein n=1 Tax=Mesorhabditis belari TaxID=2138241 RepID=A0AAF3FQG9_9BILA